MKFKIILFFFSIVFFFSFFKSDVFAVCETHTCSEELKCISTGPNLGDHKCVPIGWPCTADACPAGQRCITDGDGINDFRCVHPDWPCTPDACPRGQTCISTGNGINDFRCKLPDSETPPDDAAAEVEPPKDTTLLDVNKGPTNETFNALNPLNIAAGRPGESARSPYFAALQTPGGIISRLLLFAFPIAGMILFIMIVWGGFEMVTGATNAKSMDAGKQRITAAIIGFVLLFLSYWLMQIIEVVFGLAIL